MKLDTFALESAKSKPNFVPDVIERIVSSEPSKVPPPPDAPKWALRPDWKKGTVFSVYVFKNIVILIIIFTIDNKENTEK